MFYPNYEVEQFVRRTSVCVAYCFAILLRQKVLSGSVQKGHRSGFDTVTYFFVFDFSRFEVAVL